MTRNRFFGRLNFILELFEKILEDQDINKQKERYLYDQKTTRLL